MRIRARDKDESDAYKIMEGITVDLTKTGNTIRISTQINQNRSLVDKAISKANPFNNGSVDIDYTLLVPEFTEFDIHNRFGDITIRDLKQKIDIELTHGDLKMDRVEKGSRLELSFAKVDIEAVDDALIVLRDSRMDLKLARNLDLDSRSSKLRIDQVLDLKIESKRDEIFIRSVEEISGSSQFTKYEIELLKSICDIKMTLGDLDIERISPQFKSIRIE